MRLDELDVFRIEVSTATRQRHLSAVTTTLAQPKTTPHLSATPLLSAIASDLGRDPCPHSAGGVGLRVIDSRRRPPSDQANPRTCLGAI